MQLTTIAGAALAALTLGTAFAAGEGINPNFQGTPDLHCRKGVCNGKEIKVIVDDQQQPCRLKLQYDTVTIHRGNRGLDDQGVKLRWVIDDAKAKSPWFFYPGGIALAGNNGDLKDNGPDESKKAYAWTDLNKQDQEFTTRYTVVVADKDQKVKCSTAARIVNKGSSGAGKKKAAAQRAPAASDTPDPRVPCRGRRNTTTPCT